MGSGRVIINKESTMNLCRAWEGEEVIESIKLNWEEKERRGGH